MGYLDVLIVAPIAIIAVFVAFLVMDALQDVLVSSLASSNNSASIMTLISVLGVLLAAGIIFNIYKGFRQQEYGSSSYYRGE